MESCKGQATLEQKAEVLAIIPARGGSKGIPRKNIVDLCGKPLIAYSIEVALKSKMITRVVVSTEDEEIAEVSNDYGAEVPFLRPKELAGDRSNIGDAVNYTVDRLKKDGFMPDALVQLYPTHPFRNPQLVDQLSSILLDGYRQVTTVKPVKLAGTQLVYQKKTGGAVPLSISMTRSLSNAVFRPYGLYCGIKLTYPRPLNVYLHRLFDPISLVDIDYWEDLFFAEEVIRNNLFPFDMQ